MSMKFQDVSSRYGRATLCLLYRWDGYTWGEYLGQVWARTDGMWVWETVSGETGEEPNRRDAKSRLRQAVHVKWRAESGSIEPEDLR